MIPDRDSLLLQTPESLAKSLALDVRRCSTWSTWSWPTPPYGAAKDPVNTAGFLGANLLRPGSRASLSRDL